MENMLDAIKLEGMPGIGPTLKTGNDIVLGSQHIHNLSFAFITPLKA
jgi:hypothetical protein